MRFLALIAAASIGLSGCSVTQDKAAAEAGVQRFRQMMDGGRFQEIYRDAGPEFKQTGSEAAAVQFLRTVQGRLGRARQASQNGWRVNVTPGGTLTTLNYTTEFERGRGTESFVFRENEGRAILIGYHINSTDLVLGAPPSGPAADGGKPVAPGQVGTTR